jgi:signal transduction histidine kinase
VEQLPDVINPIVTEQQANEADAERRLKLVFCKAQDQSLRKFVKNRARHDRFAEIGKVAAVFAHEVANPLNGLSTSLQFALKDLTRFTRIDSQRKALDIPIIRDTIQGALREVDRLVELLDDFRSNVPPQSLNLKSTNLEKLVREIVALQGTGYTSCGVTVKLDFQEKLPAIEIDRSKIKQAILNLCKNAIEAMTEGGCLTIKAYLAEGMVVLEITDDGFGIPDDVDVFELFKTTKPGGTGLGLPVVQQIVSAHNGMIDFTSDPVQGTTFTVRLPSQFRRELA